MAPPGQAEQLATLLDSRDRRRLGVLQVVNGRSGEFTPGDERLGLLPMRESARLIGAHLAIDSMPGQGTRVRLRVPTEGRTAG